MSKADYDAARFATLSKKYAEATEFDCISCSEIKPITAFYKSGPNSSASRPVKSRCKDCLNRERRQRAAEDPIGTAKSRIEYQLTPKRRYIVAKKEATRRGLQFQITFEAYCKIVEKAVCEYCGVEVVSGGGLDRLDAGLGYSEANVVVCCSVCNITKNDIFTAPQMRELGCLIGEWRRAGALNIPPRLVLGKSLIVLSESR